MVQPIRKIRSIPKTCWERYLDADSDCARPFRERSVYYSGISRLHRGYHIGRTDKANTHMVIFTKEGEGHFLTADREWTLEPDTVLCVPAGHAFEFRPHDDYWYILWFYMKPTPRWSALGSRIRYAPAASIIPRMEAAMEGFLVESQRAGTNPTANHAAKLHCELCMLYLEEALLLNDRSAPAQERADLAALWQQVQDELERNWQLEDLASILNVSISTFQRRTRRHFGTTPWQIIIGMRMERAKLLLNNSDYPLKVIAERVGYADEFIFSAAFRKNLGVSPSQFRGQ